jgi:hypothetical protein
MGRVYSVSFQGVTVAAAQDLIAVLAGASMPFDVHGFSIGQITGTSSMNLRVRLRRLPATVTLGSGGSTPTPRPMIPGDAAASVTAHANDTTQASSGGTILDLYAGAFNTLNGMDFWFPPSLRPRIGLSQAAALTLDAAPAAAMTTSGTMFIEELL